MSLVPDLPGRECLGLVLAGGRSRRMGGADKALAVLDGVPLLKRVLDRFAPQCATVVISANCEPARLSAFGRPVLADEVSGYAGPLAGILAGLDWAAEHGGVRIMASISVDTPFLPLDLVARLRNAAGGGLACARSGGKRHPVAALWPLAIRHEVRRALVERQERRVSMLLERHVCAIADWPVEPLDPFFNVNTPEDLEAAEAMVGRAV